MSGNPEQEFFSDGITEDIITDLSKLSGLAVAARHSAFSCKGQAVKTKSLKQVQIGTIEAYTYYCAGANFSGAVQRLTIIRVFKNSSTCSGQKTERTPRALRNS